MQYKWAKRQVRAITLRRGIASCPDEVLSEILALAARPHLRTSYHIKRAHGLLEYRDEQRRMKAALSLSLVCAKFRSLILGNPSLWNTISDLASGYKTIGHCIAKSKNAPLDVFLQSFGYPILSTPLLLPDGPFLSSFLQSMSRWRSLSIGTTSLLGNTEDIMIWNDMHDLVEAFFEHTKGITLPLLKSLVYHSSQVPSSVLNNEEPNLHPYLHWSLPALREMLVIGPIIPPPFTNTIKCITLRFAQKHSKSFNIPKVASLLNSCHSLESANLQFRRLERGSISSCNSIDISTAKKITYVFCLCHSDEILSVCNSMHFGEAKEMVLHLEWNEELSYVDYSGLASSILAPYSASGITDLEICLGPFHVPETPASFTIPLQSLPKLKALTLRSINCSWDGIELHLKLDGQIPALRRLTIHLWCDKLNPPYKAQWTAVASWITTLFHQLLDQGDLDKFQLLTLHEFWVVPAVPMDHDAQADFTEIARLASASELHPTDGTIHDYLSPEKIHRETVVELHRYWCWWDY